MPASEIQNTAGFNDETAKSDAPASHLPRRRIAIFLIIVPTILLGANWFVFATWNHFHKAAVIPAWEIIPPALTVTFVLCMLLGFRRSGLWLRLAYRISATWLGILNLSFFAACAAWIVAAASLLLPFHIAPGLIATTCLGTVAFASIYGLINASWLRVTRVTVKLKNLPAEWQGRTAALVTDMHLGNVRGANFTRRVVAKLQQLHPAAVFISGDMFDGVEADLDALVAPWKQLSVPAGIWYVTGNHEEFTDRSKFINAVKGAGIRVLENGKADIHGLQLVGIHDGETHDAPLFKSLLQNAALDRNRASILLAHQPSNLEIPAGEGISLQLSGHTHNGQMWPWHRLAARVHGKFVYGLHRFHDMQVLTSSGAGTWGVPMRIRTKSEIVLVRFE